MFKKIFLVLLIILSTSSTYANTRYPTLKIKDNNVVAVFSNQKVKFLTKSWNHNFGMYNFIIVSPAISYKILKTEENISLIVQAYNDGKSWVTSYTHYVVDLSKKNLYIQNITTNLNKNYGITWTLYNPLLTLSGGTLFAGIYAWTEFYNEHQAEFNKKGYVLSRVAKDDEQPINDYSVKIPTIKSLITK